MASTQRQPTVEIVTDLYEAFNRGDIDTVLTKLADDIEWTEPEGSIFGGTYHSPEAVRREVFDVCNREFHPFSVEPDRFIDAGDTVVALGTFHATTGDGRRIESPFAHVWESEGKVIVRMRNYTDTALWV